MINSQKCSVNVIPCTTNPVVIRTPKLSAALGMASTSVDNSCERTVPVAVLMIGAENLYFVMFPPIRSR